MRWFYRVKRTLGERYGQACDLLAQGRNGNRLIRFEDGFLAVVPFWAVRVRR